MQGRFLSSSEAQIILDHLAGPPNNFVPRGPIYDSYGFQVNGQEYYLIDAFPGDENSPNGLHCIYQPAYEESTRYYWAQVNSGQPEPWDAETSSIQDIAGLPRVWPKGYIEEINSKVDLESRIVSQDVWDQMTVEGRQSLLNSLPSELRYATLAKFGASDMGIGSIDIIDPTVGIAQSQNDIPLSITVADQVITIQASQAESFLEEISQTNPELVDEVIEQIAEQTGIDIAAKKAGLDPVPLIKWGAIALGIKLLFFSLLLLCLPLHAQTSSSTAQRLRAYQGITTANFPLIEHTATWNNGAVAFDVVTVDITDTASAPVAYLMRFNVGGAMRFTLDKAGNISIRNSGSFNFQNRAILLSPYDGGIRLRNWADTEFQHLIFGPATVAGVSLTTNTAVGGQTQGIVITRGEGSEQIFANLGAAVNGAMIYCADCTFANPCAGGGTGAYAKRLNGVWRCD